MSLPVCMCVYIYIYMYVICVCFYSGPFMCGLMQVKRMGDILKDTAELLYMVNEKPEFAKELEMPLSCWVDEWSKGMIGDCCSSMQPRNARYVELIAKSAWRLFAAVPSEVKDQVANLTRSEEDSRLRVSPNVGMWYSPNSWSIPASFPSGEQSVRGHDGSSRRCGV